MKIAEDEEVAKALEILNKKEEHLQYEAKEFRRSAEEHRGIAKSHDKRALEIESDIDRAQAAIKALVIE